MTKVLFFALLLLSTSNAFDVCHNVSDRLNVSTLNLTPDQPVPGSKFTAEIDFTPTASLASLSVNVAIKVYGVKVDDLQFDLCKTGGLTCPLAKGKKQTASLSYALPSVVPENIKVSAELNFTNGSTKESCLDTTVHVGKKSSTPTTIVTLLRGVASSPLATSTSDDFDHFLWRAYLKQYNLAKEYGSNDSRRTIFLANIAKIKLHNDDFDNGKHSFFMAANEFAHLTSDEFKESYASGFLPEEDIESETILGSSGITDAEVPSSVDWVAKGAVTNVKNQGICGSCWTFSAAGALEGAYQIAGNPLTSFSEEQILDCDKGGHGCAGGSMDQAFEWFKSQQGVCSLDEYPYDEAQTKEGAQLKDQCNSECTAVTTVTGFTDVDATEKAMKAAVAQQPVSVAIEADQSAFHFYAGGVLDATCGTNLDHGVLVVGYGTDADSGKDYWKIKNSWGTSWGEKGYVRIVRGDSSVNNGKGQCGVLQMASYPTVG